MESAPELMRSPRQSPGCGVAELDVKTMGWDCAPWARRRAVPIVRERAAAKRSSTPGAKVRVGVPGPETVTESMSS